MQLATPVQLAGGEKGAALLARQRLYMYRPEQADLVDWFNNRWLLEPIGNIPPAEAEERY